MDAGTDVDRALANLNAIECGSILMQWLQGLPYPLISDKLQVWLLRSLIAEDEMEKMRRIQLVMLLLPFQHLMALRFIFLHLKKVSGVPQNHMTSSKLAQVFKPCLAANTDFGTKHRKKNLLAIIKMLIEHAELVGVIPNAILDNSGY